MEPTKVNLAVLKDTSSQENSVLGAMNQNTGTQSVKNVSPVMQDIFGLMISMFVTAVRPQDKSSTINALAQLPQLFGMEINVLAQLTPSEPTVSLAQILDSGMVITVLALITESGTVKIVFVEQDYSVQTVFLAQPQDHGKTPLNNVYAQTTESGTVKTVFALLDFTDQTVNHAHFQENG